MSRWQQFFRNSSWSSSSKITLISVPRTNETVEEQAEHIMLELLETGEIGKLGGIYFVWHESNEIIIEELHRFQRFVIAIEANGGELVREKETDDYTFYKIQIKS
jgi:hypothetical protein